MEVSSQLFPTLCKNTLYKLLSRDNCKLVISKDVVVAPLYVASSAIGFQLVPPSLLTSHWKVSAVESMDMIEVDPSQKATSSKDVFSIMGAPIL
ncbi:MAG: Uncharacterised protein [Flavobacterium sp. SCGC AAA160-P02]|nr:MAG: Uncharacterised protein [Flavobacterium sp. SCGC AAA160-P02]